MKKLVFFIYIFYSSFAMFSQKGKNGAGNIVASSIVNAYTALTVDAFSGNTSITVASAAGYAVGDLVYIIQMQGANVNCYLVPFGNPNNPGPYGPEFGKITNYNNAGNNEYAEVSSVSGNVITIDCPLKNNYTAAGKVQVVKVPRYTSLTIGAAGIITCPTWNGTTGGVISLEVDGNTTIAAGGKIDASALGFRGGIVIGKTVSSVFGGGSWGNNNVNEGGYKGESIAGDVALYLANFNGPYCKGAVANGGGGGNGNNAGGGGGANAGDTSLYTGSGNPDISVAGYVTAWNLETPAFSTTLSSGGGRGGYSYSTANINPRTNAPALAVWNGDQRRVSGGQGGRPLYYNTGRLFSGGGGGAADENDAFGGAGGHGGGIINIISYGTVSGGGQILSNGENGFNSLTPAPGFAVSGRDGAGGGGGGGAIVINSLGSISAITVSAKGGDGGNQQMKNGGGTTAQAYGPGGGGGGGYIGTTVAAITTNVAGGVNGTVQYLSGTENCQIDIVPTTNCFPANGATIGGSGLVISTLLVVPTITASPDVTICVNNSTNLTATTTAVGATIGWYTAVAGGTQLGTGSAFTTSVFTVPGTYTVFAGFCPSGIYRDPVVITVTNGPTLTPVSATVCAGQTGTISVSGATTYTWAPSGSNSPTITAAPLSTTVYTVTGSIGTCTTAITATITVNTSGTINATSSTICSGQNATLTAGAALSYTWSTGANTQTVSVNPTTTTVYTINATLAGGCVVTNTALVTVNTSPTLSAVSTTVCAGKTGTISVSGATSYTWAITGANTFSTSATPFTTTTYSVVGANGTCTSSANATITVNPNPTITVISSTVCVGQTGTIVASGAGSYTWASTGATNPTFTASPAITTTYVVNGTSGTCTSSATGTITVNTAAPITVNSSTICSGQNALLTAGAATSYTWSTGANTQTASVSPVTTTVYTVNATTAGGCVTSNMSTVIVNATPTLVLASTTICVGQTGTLSVSGAPGYTWNTGSNSPSITASPATTTTYNVVGANGTCTASATASISVGAVGSIAVNSPTICTGQSVILTAGAAASYTWGTGANTQTVSVNPAATTVYTLSAITSGGCNAVGSSTVTVNSNPVLSVTNATICVGQTGTISASGATTYTWNTTQTTPTITAAPAVTTTYAVTGANGTCTSSATASISVNSSTLAVNSPSMCYNQPAILNAGPAISYTWSTGANTQSIVVAPPTNSVYIVSATLPGGCVVTNTSNVTVAPIPTVSAPNASICAGQSATVTATGAPNFTWTFGGTTAQVVLTPTQSTGYTFTGIGTNGCYAMSSMTVFIVPPPIVSATSATVCAGQAATLTASGATSYTWDPSGFNVVNPSFTDAPLATTIYTVVGAVNGCTAITTASIVIGSNLSISVNTPTICSGQTATLIATSTATNYLWSTTAVTQTIFVTPLITTSYTVTGSKGACTGTAVTNVVVNPSPNVTITANPICAGGSATLILSGAPTATWSNGANNVTSTVVTPTVNTTYTAIGSNGSCTTQAVYNLTISPIPTINSANATICNGATATLTANGATNYTWLPSGTQSNSVTVSPTANTTYTVIGDNGSCSAQTTVTVSVLNGLIAPTSNASICQGQTATIGTTLTGTSYLWSNGATTQSISITPSSTISYSVLVVVGSCSYTGNSTVTVVPTPTLLLSSASICVGDVATLSASGATNGYTWNPGNLTGNTVTVSPGTTTGYVVTSANGVCPATATTQVIVNTKPVLTVFQTADLVCPNTPVTFSASGANIYEWYINGSSYHFGNSLTVTPSQNSTITLVGSNGGCSTTTLAGIQVSDVVASFIPESNFVDYPGTLTFTNTSVGATNIAWDLGNGQTYTNSICTGYYENPGKYLVALVAQNSMGCIDTALYLIEAGCGKGDFYIPNTFTPNGDGLNDQLLIMGGSCVTQFKGSVFDRWGTEIFKWKNIEDRWDGTCSSKEVEIGVYNYLITYTLYNGKVFSKTGHIAIIR